jgi:hypothetical protein
VANTIIENLITTLTFNTNERILLKFSKGIEKIFLQLEAMVKFATNAARSIFDFTENVAVTNDQIGKLAQRLGIDVKALQELGFVAELNGASIESMNSALESISQTIADAARGMGDGVETFGILGISVTDAEGRLRSADDMLLNIADSIAMLSTQAERAAFAQRLGISGQLLLAIQQGSAAIREQRKEAEGLNFAIGVEGAQAAADFNDDLLRLRRILLGIRNLIATRLMAAIEPMIEMWVKWLKTNNLLIRQGINRFIDMTMNSLFILRNILARVVSLVEFGVNAIGGWENGIKALTAALLILNRALIKPLLVLAGFIGFLILLDDLKTFAEGGDSAIGNLIERFPSLSKPINLLLKILSKVAEGWNLIFTEGDRAIEGLIALTRDLKDYTIQAYDDIRDHILETFDEISERYEILVMDVRDLLNKLPWVNIQPEGPALIAPVGAGVLRAAGFGETINNTTNNNTSNPNISISINGNNESEMRQTLYQILNEQYQAAIGNLSSEKAY